MVRRDWHETIRVSNVVRKIGVNSICDTPAMSADGADGADGAGVVVSVSQLLSPTQLTAFHRITSGFNGTFLSTFCPHDAS